MMRPEGALLFPELELPPLEQRPWLHLSLPERFARFHAGNPAVYAGLCKLALEMLGLGWRRCSMDMLFHLLRWSYGVQTHGDEYRLNNNYTSFYARPLMEREPRLAGFFETRRKTSRDL